MSDNPMAKCAKCDSEITAGTLFCWTNDGHHTQGPPQIATYLVDHGQLGWQSKDNAAVGRMERALAVVVGGAQAKVLEVIEMNARQPHLNLKLSLIRAGRESVVYAHIGVLKLFKEIVRGSEEIEATLDAE